MTVKKMWWIVIGYGILIIIFKILELIKIIPVSHGSGWWSWVAAIAIMVNGILILKKER